MGILQYDRKKFFEGVGTEIGENQQGSLEKVIKAAKLDYVVEKVKSYDEDGEEIGSYHTRYIDEDGIKQNLGFGLKKQYKVLQNYQCFYYLQDMLQDVTVECAGTTDGSRKSFICVKTDPIKVLDEEIDPYMVMQNSFDGSGSVKIMLTPIRVFCSNCMTMAIKEAQSIFTIRHSKSVHDRLYIAQDVLLKNTKYLEAYKEQIEEMAKVRFTRRQFVDKLIPFVLTEMGLLDEEGKPIEKKRNQNIVEVYRDQLLACWSAEDTKNQENTLVNAYNALTSFESHVRPMRNSDKPETKFNQVLKGMLLSNAAIKYAFTLVNYKSKF